MANAENVANLMAKFLFISVLPWAEMRAAAEIRAAPGEGASCLPLRSLRNACQPA
jgi:hypothetical protein